MSRLICAWCGCTIKEDYPVAGGFDSHGLCQPYHRREMAKVGLEGNDEAHETAATQASAPVECGAGAAIGGGIK